MTHVWIVVLHDRHIDDVITVHADQASAEQRVVDIKSDYPHDYQWEFLQRHGSWVSHDDGPSIDIALYEVQP